MTLLYIMYSCNWRLIKFIYKCLKFHPVFNVAFYSMSVICYALLINSLPSCFVLDPASPGPVGNITVHSPSVDQLKVTWTPSTTGGVPTSYNVSINDGSSPVVIPGNGASLYTHTFTGLTRVTHSTLSLWWPSTVLVIAPHRVTSHVSAQEEGSVGAVQFK